MNITPINSINFTSKVSLDVDSISTKLLTEFGDDFRAVIKEFESNGRKDEVVIRGDESGEMRLDITTNPGFVHFVPVEDSKVEELMDAYVAFALNKETFKETLGKIPQGLNKEIQRAYKEKLIEIKNAPRNIKKSIMNAYNSFYKKFNSVE